MSGASGDHPQPHGPSASEGSRVQIGQCQLHVKNGVDHFIARTKLTPGNYTFSTEQYQEPARARINHAIQRSFDLTSIPVVIIPPSAPIPPPPGTFPSPK